MRKKAMEQNLTLLNFRIVDVLQRNRNVQAHIAELENSTQEQAEVVKRWKTSNEFLRDAMSALQDKMRTAREFLIESINHTDPAGARELTVLQSTTSPPSTETFLHFFEDGPWSDTEVSLLTTAVERRTVPDQGLQSESLAANKAIPELSKNLAALAEAESEGEAQLRGRYIAIHEVGEARLHEAQAAGRALLEREEELATLGRRLNQALEHLKQANEDMLPRVYGMKTFAIQAYERNGKALHSAAQEVQLGLARAAAVRSGSAEQEPANATQANATDEGNVTALANGTEVGNDTASAEAASSPSWAHRGRGRRHHRGSFLQA